VTLLHSALSSVSVEIQVICYLKQAGFYVAAATVFFSAVYLCFEGEEWLG